MSSQTVLDYLKVERKWWDPLSLMRVFIVTDDIHTVLTTASFTYLNTCQLLFQSVMLKTVAPPVYSGTELHILIHLLTVIGFQGSMPSVSVRC